MQPLNCFPFPHMNIVGSEYIKICVAHSCIKLFTPSAMDKSVLLVLLCLQVFLLITVFKSTDATTNLRDDDRPPDLGGDEVRRNVRRRQNSQNKRNRPPSNCSYRSGACGEPGETGPAPPAPPSPPPPAPPAPPPPRPDGREPNRDYY